MKRLGIKILLFIVAGIILQAVFDFPLTFDIVLFPIIFTLSIWKREFLWLFILPLSGINFLLKTPPEIEYPKRDLLFIGQVIAEDHRERDVKLTIDLERIIHNCDTIPFNNRVYFYTLTQRTLLGKELFIKGKISSSPHHARLNVLSGKIVDVRTSHYLLGSLFYPIRNYIDNLFSHIFNQTHYKLSSSLILGGSSRIGKDLKEAFSRAGVLHILAVSGLHIGFVCVFVGALLLFIPIPNEYKYLITIFVLILYAGITGFRPSVCRATLMASLFGLAGILQRNVDGMHIVNITAIILLIINPLLVFDVGAQLSFAAVYGIIYLYKKIDFGILRKIKDRRVKTILAPMAVSFSAQLFVSPLLIHYFNRLPTLAVFSNLLVVPIASVIVFLLFLCLIIGIFYLPLVRIIAMPIGLLLDGLTIICKTITEIPFSTISLKISPIILLLIYLLFPKKLRKFGIYLLITTSIFASLSSSPEFCVVEVSRNHALVFMPSGENLFITQKKSFSKCIQFLSNRGIEKLDYLIARNRFYPVKNNFIELPERRHYKAIKLGKISIEIERVLKIRYRDAEIILNNEISQLERNEITYIVTNGKEKIRINEYQYGSIIDKIITEIKILYAKLRLCVWS